MFDNAVMREMTSRHIMEDRMREAEQYRLLKSAEAARRPRPAVGRVLSAIRQALAVRRTFIRPTTTAG